MGSMKTFIIGRRLLAGRPMSNITLSVDEEIIKKVRKIALGKITTLTEMVREFLKSVAECDLPKRERTLRKLEVSFQNLSREMGKKKWKRGDLYKR